MRLIYNFLFVSLFSFNSLVVECSDILPEGGIKQISHTITIDQEVLNYTTKTGFLDVAAEDKSQVVAKLFYVSYELKIEDKKNRPITFIFGGGPGAATVFTHMSGVGPKRIALYEDGTFTSFPVTLEDNPQTWLRFTDLVFLDTVGMGFSQIVSSEQDKDYFFSVAHDVESIGKFISLYLTSNARWGSPKFISSGSYGGFRACKLSKYLSDQLGIGLNGIIINNPTLNYQIFHFDSRNDILPFISFFPSYAIAARYYKKLQKGLCDKPFEVFIKEVEKFCVEEYAPFLLKGGSVTEDEREMFLIKIQKYIGLERRLLLANNFRIDESTFRMNLLGNENKNIGLYDSSFVGKNFGNKVEYPAEGNWFVCFADAINRYLLDDLKWKYSGRYIIFNDDAFKQWDFGFDCYSKHNKHKAIDSTDDLLGAMRVNKFLKIFVGAGYYDLAIPYFATKYHINHLILNDDLKKRITMKFYESGHMIYPHPSAMKKFNKDVELFYSELV